MCYYFCFASLVHIPVGIASSTLGLDVSAITAGIKTYKSIIKKKKKKNDIIVVLVKTKLNTINVLISKTLINHVLVTMNFFQ